MKYDYKIMDNKFLICCTSCLHVRMRVFACLMVLRNHGGVSRMLCYDMLCYAIDMLCYDMLC